MLSRFGAAVVDMEASAIANAAQKFNLPWNAIKAVSDEASFAMPLNLASLPMDLALSGILPSTIKNSWKLTRTSS